MPVYGNNSYIMSCKSDTQVLTISAPISTTLSQKITFAFTGGQVFTSRGNTATLPSYFGLGERVWLDSIRVTVPNLSGLVASNNLVDTTGASGSYIYFYPDNSIDSVALLNNVVLNTNVLNEWIPINELSPRTNMFSAKNQFIPDNVSMSVDFRNADTSIYNGITIYAYLELKVNAITAPTI